MQPITNSRLLELRRRRQSCQQAVDDNLCFAMEKDFLDLYDVFEKFRTDNLSNDERNQMSILF